MARLLKPDFVKFLPIREFHQIQSGKIIFSHPDAQVYYCMKQIRIDTVGYDDSTNRNDEDNFKEVLKFIDNHSLQNVHAIVWTISPTPRMDAKLQKQANFINQFGEGKIWKNVVIVAK